MTKPRVQRSSASSDDPPSCNTPDPEWRLHQLFETTAKRFPERPLFRAAAPIVYRDARVRVRLMADGLRLSGVSPGDRVLIVSEPCPEAALAIFAISAVGGIFTVLPLDIRAAALAQIRDQVEPKVALLGREAEHLADLFEVSRVLSEDFAGLDSDSDRPVPPGPVITSEDIACLIFTSGSTGTPRGVTISHGNLQFSLAAIQDRLGYRVTDTVGVFLPLSFDYGLYQVLLAVQVGAAVHLADGASVGLAWLQEVDAGEVSIFPAVPSLLKRVLRLVERRPGSLKTLRAITSTGDFLPQLVIERLQRALPAVEVFSMYGLTECKRVSIRLPEEAAAKPASVGRPLDGTSVYAQGDDGNRLAAGGTGELVVRGPHVTLGYWKSPEATENWFRTGADGARELLTGDLGRVDEDGFVYVLGRRDGLLKHRGFRVSSAEIEAAALRIPGVVEAAVVRARTVDDLHLFLTATEDLPGQAAIQRQLATHLEAYKLPDHIHFVEDLPRTAHGKIARSRLVQRISPQGTR